MKEKEFKQEQTFKKRNNAPWWGIILIIVGVAFAINRFGTIRIRGTGNMVTEVREVGQFDKVQLDTFGDVSIEQGAEISLKVEADDNLMRYVDTDVRGNTLHLDVGRNVRSLSINNSRLRFELTVPDLDAVEIDGSGNIEIGDFQTDQFDLVIDGSGDIDMDRLQANSLEIEIGGSGNVTVQELIAEEISTNVDGSGNISLAGSVEKQQLEINGSGDYRAKDLISAEAEIDVDGSGDTTISVSDQLEIDINGSGNVNYYGSPSIDQSINGSGDINNRGGR